MSHGRWPGMSWFKAIEIRFRFIGWLDSGYETETTQGYTVRQRSSLTTAMAPRGSTSPSTVAAISKYPNSL